MKLSSPAFMESETIPTKHTCDGIDISPALEWQNAPDKCRSFAVICEDPDAPAGLWVHWIIFNIPADTTHLPQALPKIRAVLAGAKQGVNDFGDLGYGGPCPPGKTVHRYYFRVYALDKMLVLDSGADRAQLLAAMKGHILEETHLMGKYVR